MCLNFLLILYASPLVMQTCAEMEMLREHYSNSVRFWITAGSIILCNAAWHNNFMHNDIITNFNNRLEVTKLRKLH